jgi:hypothetical protein
VKFSPGFPGAGKTCWPPMEVLEDVGRRIYTLGVTEEEQRISFMKNLTHGNSP